MDFKYESNRIALYNDENELVAVVDFPAVDNNTVDINHTFVDDSLRGQGIAGKLMEAVAKELLTQNKKAILSCSYAKKWFENHSEYSQILK